MWYNQTKSNNIFLTTWIHVSVHILIINSKNVFKYIFQDYFLTQINA